MPLLVCIVYDAAGTHGILFTCIKVLRQLYGVSDMRHLKNGTTEIRFALTLPLTCFVSHQLSKDLWTFRQCCYIATM